MNANKSRAVAAARALMRSAEITAAAASRQIAADFGLSPETLRRAVLEIDYSKQSNGNLYARVEQLELRLAELEFEVEVLKHRKLSRELEHVIRRRYDDGEPVARLAEHYAISPSMISRIAKRAPGDSSSSV